MQATPSVVPPISDGTREISRSEARHLRKNQKRGFKTDKIANNQIISKSIYKIKRDKAPIKTKNQTKNRVINQARGKNN